MDSYNFISLAGLVILIGLGVLFSTNRKSINWHVVVWGVGLQFLIAWFLFVVPAGVKFFSVINDLVIKVLESASAGSKFLFGPLALAPGQISETGERSLGFILAFQVFPTIIFFSALISILYYIGFIPILVKGFAYLFTKLMRVSGAESLCAASNIFVGVESSLIIQPFLKEMTASELCTVLTAGMGTISSNVMALYVFSLQKVFPNIAGHLVTASLLSAPAALVMSKLLLPETGQPKTLGEHVEPNITRENNIVEAIINGAQSGLKLIGGIAALLVAVLGLVSLADQALGFLGQKINMLGHFSFDWSFKNILGIVFYPLTLILGMPPQDASVLAKIIGERVVVTEVVSYQDLAQALKDGLLSHPRSAVLATYALCGFAHLASMAIFIGGIAALAPETIKVLARIGFRSLVAATLTGLMTANVAGVFYTGRSFLLGQ